MTELQILNTELTRLQQIQHDAAGRIDTLTLKALALYMREQHPSAVYLDLAEGDQGDQDVVVDQIIDADGGQLDLAEALDDDTIITYVMQLLAFRLTEHPLVENRGTRRSRTWRLNLPELAAMVVMDIPVGG